ncbi:hypothetical protein K470DRAFT_217689 [Piedraia hortae CBS 480.64]|uniref:tRNA-splicing endonuclease subunit Sen15 domain-containing protein n=1 Tax=Piedraia hortae CBS 480.64 TaxID=1314780 RepID=A0A6A7BXW6_9PEZI|nr:hypothetical protein K470DRAFT_217689 [Piedraia hortae CBS 480.64]
MLKEKVSALDSFIQSNSSPDDPPTRALALQIAHNLYYQHNWRAVRIHNSEESILLSGLPPKPLYTHPDEQIALLEQGATARAEREWILPSQMRQRWNLKTLGQVFNGIGKVPGEDEGKELHFSDTREGAEGIISSEISPWRLKNPKRLLLATVEDDGTIVYYVVHDGLVKPRQN